MKTLFYSLLFLVTISCVEKKHTIDLSGSWNFAIDSLDKGITEEWFEKQLLDSVQLPASMSENGKGNDISVYTKWTGQIMDSSWYNSEKYKKYRRADNIKIPFWLQPVKHYVGAAWYQKEFDLPSNRKGKQFELYLERCHISTQVWVNGISFTKQNALSTPHIYNITKALKEGKNKISVLVDNRLIDFNVGSNSHSVTDHTQTNWNGIVGKIQIQEVPTLQIGDVKITSDIKDKKINVQFQILDHFNTGSPAKLRISASAIYTDQLFEEIEKEIQLDTTKNLSIDYVLGAEAELWDEFNPALYKLKIELLADGVYDSKEIQFGLREFNTRGTQFAVNNRPVFLRGALECAIFPLTGYVATDTAAWMRIFRIAKSYGLNHIRFHSYCPPEAAFDAADRMGFYLQVECSSWANFDVTIGDGKPIDKYIYDESARIVNEYGNHPSFCLMLYGNEPTGDNHAKWLNEFVAYWKKKDSRRIYTTGAGWTFTEEAQFSSTTYPRILNWMDNIFDLPIAASSSYDWCERIKDTKVPTISHEIGQWCVYPDFKEIKKYTGVLQAKNYEIFKESLSDSGMFHLADSFLFASGKLQALCYKAEIEAALRTKNFGGFQLLGLHDFPGQGTALVGVLNAFWEEKGYITASEYRNFCNYVVPLARFTKFVFQNSEKFAISTELLNFGNSELKSCTPVWEIVNSQNEIIATGKLNTSNFPIGNCLSMGAIVFDLSKITSNQLLKLIVKVDKFQNSWEFFVYVPQNENITTKVLVTSRLDNNVINFLKNGGNVLLTLKKDALKPDKGGNIAVRFSSIFWNTAWFGKMPPNTLGILCNPKHPALAEFPTQLYSNYQWHDILMYANAINLSDFSTEINPIVRIIDDWFTNRPLSLIFEAQLENGKIIVCGSDLITDIDKRIAAKQLRYSLTNYMDGGGFNPQTKISSIQLSNLLK